MTRAEFINKYSNLAINSTQGTKVLPSVVMAQAILESGNGNSSLTTDYNNFFGIKAGSSWTGKSVNMNTREEDKGQSYYTRDNFRVYDSAWSSFADHTKFVEDYGVEAGKTPAEQAQILKNRGYATAGDYVPLLLGIIDDNNLEYLDQKKKLCAGLI